jgi:hypothetical protein
MKATRKQITARVFKKLSALRATMSNEERAILDRLIAAQEVSAHKLTSKAVNKVASKSATKAAEVAAHKLTSKAVNKVASKSATKAAEVQAHRIATRATNKVADKAAEKVAMRIAFDPNSEEYKIQE